MRSELERRTRNRQWRRLVVVVSTPGLMLGSLALGAASALGAFTPQATAVTGSCAEVRLMAPQGVELIVLNGSGVDGRAALAAKELRRVGFRVKSVGNVPESEWTDLPAVVSYGERAAGTAARVVEAVPGAKFVNDRRPGSVVQVVIGTEFAHATKPPTGAIRALCP
jgi:hypothetical protein